MAAKDTLPLHDKALFLLLVPLLLIRCIIALTFKPNRSLHWRQHLALRFLQSQRSTFPTRILRWYVRRTGTGAAISGYCATKNIPHQSVTLQSASSSPSLPPGVLHILTPPNPNTHHDRTLLYFHGGGFVNPLRGNAHMPFIIQCGAACHASRVAVLEYALAPEHTYPAQLIHSIAALTYLLEDLALSAEDIILAGDSAGGQMVGSLLAHLATPSPYAVPLSFTGQIGGALFISPFTLLNLDERSYIRNEGRDYLTRDQVRGFKCAWGPKEGEVWADLCGASHAEGVWETVFRGGDKNGVGLVRKVMITVGTGEVFLDCCRVFAGHKFAKAERVVIARSSMEMGHWSGVLRDKDVVFVECQGEVHVQPALDAAVRYEDGIMRRTIITWLENL
ncbi:Alpha/Beta hydrolase protein [Apodospora peruviana]|uniref:Alpha/Beta hydrolase protein n=1 Tax=Apodospora peruviana TaxID=516989 RepID=A0AAE0IPH9_9PEZI|nr:Alpha/Beta hydrolase protein [Apodospora peruviana]